MRTRHSDHSTARELPLSIQPGTSSRRLGGLPAFVATVLFLTAVTGAADGPAAPATGAQEQPPGQQARILLADVQALHEQVQNLQTKLGELTRITPTPGNPAEPGVPAPALPLEEQTRQLTQQREQMAQAVRQLQTQLQQLQAGREQERQQIQQELSACQQRLRALDEQLAELERQQRVRDLQ